MEILSAIIQMLGGLAMFLYGIEVMGDGLKNSSGEALKRVLEKVTGNVFMGVLTGTIVTAVIQSSTATIVLAVALIGAGVLNLKQAVSIVYGANIGTTITAWLTNLAFMESGDNWLLWLFDTDTLAPIALFAGIVLIMFIKSNKTKTIGDICIGFGILFVGLMNMTGAVKGFADSPMFVEFLSSFSQSPLLGIIAGLVITVIVQSSSATVAMLQSLSATGAMDFAGVYPIIMLSAKGEIFDKVLGLELGADDYVIKPFDSKELVARVKAVLRRTVVQPAPTTPAAPQGDVVSFPDLVVNLTNYSVQYMGQTIDMPPKELELLYFLASSPNRVFTREQLLDRIWGYEYIGDTRTVDVHIKRLREKIKDHPAWTLATVWGIGYKFEVRSR